MDHKAKTIEELQRKLGQVEQEAGKIKRAINLLCELDNEPPKYVDLDEGSRVATQLQGDEYHNMPQATTITAILERRRSCKLGPATIDELYGEMIAGGFEFTKGKNEAIQKRGVAIAMSKNRKFYKLPNEKWGIKTWYGIKEAREEPNNGPSQVAKETTEGGEPQSSNPDVESNDADGLDERLLADE